MLFYFSTFLFCFCFQNNFRFWLGGAAYQTPRFLAGGALQTLPLNGRPQHLIEAAKPGRLYKIEVRLGLAHKMTFAKCSGQCYIWKPKNP